jgi:hypothetical protein
VGFEGRIANIRALQTAAGHLERSGREWKQLIASLSPPLDDADEGLESSSLNHKGSGETTDQRGSYR